MIFGMKLPPCQSAVTNSISSFICKQIKEIQCFIVSPFVFFFALPIIGTARTMSIAINFGLCRSRKVFVVCLHRNVSRETRDAANCKQVCNFIFSSQRLRICLGKQLKFPNHGTRRNELLGTKSRGNCDKHCNSTTSSTFPISSSLSKRDRFFDLGA